MQERAVVEPERDAAEEKRTPLWQYIFIIPISLVLLLGMVLVLVGGFLFFNFGIPALLTWGPAETWDRTQRAIGLDEDLGGEECEGFRAWMEESNERGEQVVTIAEGIERRDLDSPSELRRAERDLRTLQDEQAASDPPPAAEELNDMTAAVIGLMADSIEALQDGDTREYRRISREINSQSQTLNDLDKEARQACL